MSISVTSPTLPADEAAARAARKAVARAQDRLDADTRAKAAQDVIDADNRDLAEAKAALARADAKVQTSLNYLA